MWEIHEEQYLSKRGKQPWVEGEVTSQASADPPRELWSRVDPSELPPRRKEGQDFVSILSWWGGGGVLPFSSEHKVGNVAILAESDFHQGMSGSVLKSGRVASQVHHDKKASFSHCPGLELIATRYSQHGPNLTTRRSETCKKALRVCGEHQLSLLCLASWICGLVAFSNSRHLQT